MTVNQDGEEEIWPAESAAVTDGCRVKVYGLGAGSWIWDCEARPGPTVLCDAPRVTTELPSARLVRVAERITEAA